jgi:hypothetical protein
MTLQIDGYVKPDASIALEQGVSFVYPTKYGDITIRSKMAGRDNVKFRLAMQNYQQWQQRRKNLDAKEDSEADKRFLGIVYDSLVIAWSTTITSEMKPIEPTRDNFISLLSSDACSKVLSVYLQDASDEDAFRPLSDEELEGNSPAASDGTSDGPQKKNGSAK